MPKPKSKPANKAARRQARTATPAVPEVIGLTPFSPPSPPPTTPPPDQVEAWLRAEREEALRDHTPIIGYDPYTTPSVRAQEAVAAHDTNAYVVAAYPPATQPAAEEEEEEEADGDEWDDEDDSDEADGDEWDDEDDSDEDSDDFVDELPPEAYQEPVVRPTSGRTTGVDAEPVAVIASGAADGFPTDMPLPPRPQKVRLSEPLDLADVQAAAGGAKYPQYKGYFLKIRRDVSLGFMAAAEALQDAARDAERTAQKESLRTGRRTKVTPSIKVEHLRAILADIVVGWNFPDEYGRALPQPPQGLLALRGDLLIATFERAVMGITPAKPRSRRLRRR